VNGKVVFRHKGHEALIGINGMEL